MLAEARAAARRPVGSINQPGGRSCSAEALAPPTTQARGRALSRLALEMIKDRIIVPVVSPNLALAYRSNVEGVRYSACCNLPLAEISRSERAAADRTTAGEHRAMASLHRAPARSPCLCCCSASSRRVPAVPPDARPIRSPPSCGERQMQQPRPWSRRPASAGASTSSLPEQYLIYVGNLLDRRPRHLVPHQAARGDRTICELRLPATLELVVAAMLVGTMAGVRWACSRHAFATAPLDHVARLFALSARRSRCSGRA